MKETLFRTQTENPVYCIGCAVRRGVEVAHLELAKQTDTQHLDSGENEDSGDDEDGPVKRHDVLAG